MVENIDEFLLTVYREVHIHHREQVMTYYKIATFYLTTVSLFVGLSNFLTSTNNYLMINCAFVILLIVGVLVNMMLIQSRIWQVRYASCLQFIGSLFLCDKKIKNYDDFFKAMNGFECKSKSKHSLFAPLTCKIIWACVTVSLAPIFLYYEYLLDLFYKRSCLITIVFLLFIVTYLIFIFLIFKRKIRNIGIKGEVNWLFNFDNYK